MADQIVAFAALLDLRQVLLCPLAAIVSTSALATIRRCGTPFVSVVEYDVYPSQDEPPRTGCSAASKASWSRPVSDRRRFALPSSSKQRKLAHTRSDRPLRDSPGRLRRSKAPCRLGPTTRRFCGPGKAGRGRRGCFSAPPDAFDVALVVGDVGLVEVDPEADAARSAAPTPACSARRFAGTSG